MIVNDTSDNNNNSQMQISQSQLLSSTTTSITTTTSVPFNIVEATKTTAMLVLKKSIYGSSSSSSSSGNSDRINNKNTISTLSSSNNTDSVVDDYAMFAESSSSSATNMNTMPSETTDSETSTNQTVSSSISEYVNPAVQQELDNAEYLFQQSPTLQGLKVQVKFITPTNAPSVLASMSAADWKKSIASLTGTASINNITATIPPTPNVSPRMITTTTTPASVMTNLILSSNGGGINEIASSYELSRGTSIDPTDDMYVTNTAHVDKDDTSLKLLSSPTTAVGTNMDVEDSNTTNMNPQTTTTTTESAVTITTSPFKSTTTTTATNSNYKSPKSPSNSDNRVVIPLLRSSLTPVDLSLSSSRIDDNDEQPTNNNNNKPLSLTSDRVNDTSSAVPDDSTEKTGTQDPSLNNSFDSQALSSTDILLDPSSSQGSSSNNQFMSIALDPTTNTDNINTTSIPITSSNNIADAIASANVTATGTIETPHKKSKDKSNNNTNTNTANNSSVSQIIAPITPTPTSALPTVSASTLSKRNRELKTQLLHYQSHLSRPCVNDIDIMTRFDEYAVFLYNSQPSIIESHSNTNMNTNSISTNNINSNLFPSSNNNSDNTTMANTMTNTFISSSDTSNTTNNTSKTTTDIINTPSQIPLLVLMKQYSDLTDKSVALYSVLMYLYKLSSSELSSSNSTGNISSTTNQLLDLFLRNRNTSHLQLFIHVLFNMFINESSVFDASIPLVPSSSNNNSSSSSNNTAITSYSSNNIVDPFTSDSMNHMLQLQLQYDQICNRKNDFTDKQNRIDFLSNGYGLSLSEECTQNLLPILDTKIMNPHRDWYWLFSAAAYHTKVACEMNGVSYDPYVYTHPLQMAAQREEQTEVSWLPYSFTASGSLRRLTIPTSISDSTMTTSSTVTTLPTTANTTMNPAMTVSSFAAVDPPIIIHYGVGHTSLVPSRSRHKKPSSSQASNTSSNLTGGSTGSMKSKRILDLYANISLKRSRLSTASLNSTTSTTPPHDLSSGSGSARDRSNKSNKSKNHSHMSDQGRYPFIITPLFSRVTNKNIKGAYKLVSVTYNILYI